MTQLKINLDGTQKNEHSLQVGFLANPSQQQENEKARKTTGISGRNILELSRNSNLIGSWQKMFTEYLIGEGEWFSNRCVLIWKARVTKFKRLYFQLSAKTRRTEGTGYGLLLTQMQRAETPEKMRERAKEKGYKNGTKYNSLISQVLYSDLLPTPLAEDGRRKGRPLRTRPGKKDDNKLGSYMGYLKDFAHEGLLPTPRCATNNGRGYAKNTKKGLLEDRICELLPTPSTRDHKGMNSIENTRDKIKKGERGHMGQLPNYIGVNTNHSGQLNPRFVGEMMGFPDDWLIRPFTGEEPDYSNPGFDGFPRNYPVETEKISYPGISATKHRNESIKAYGNAIVPQISLELFKAIEKCTQ